MSYTCDLCGTKFNTQKDLDNHIQQSIENGKRIGGKFELLARILEGDAKALESFEQLVKAGLIGPGWDDTPSKN